VARPQGRPAMGEDFEGTGSGRVPSPIGWMGCDCWVFGGFVLLFSGLGFVLSDLLSLFSGRLGWVIDWLVDLARREPECLR